MATIRQSTKRGSIALIGAVAIVITCSSLTMGYIRVGGPMHAREAMISTFVADIMPPPAYAIEPMLEVSQLVHRPETLPESKEALARLERAYRERASYWDASALDSDLRLSRRDEAGKFGEAFWEEVDGQLIPAVERGDMAAAERSYDEVRKHFDQHRGAIEKLTLSGTKRSDEVAALTGTVVTWATLGMAMLGLVALGMMALGTRLLFTRVLDPLLGVSGTMEAMAAGDLDRDETRDHREDEIGAMTRSIEVFRDAARHQKAMAQEQDETVRTFADALGRLSDGDLRFRISRDLPRHYAQLGEAFNATMARLETTLVRVKQASNGVRNGAREIGSASDNLALRNTRQAASVEESAASMGLVTGLISATATRTATASETILNASKEAGEGCLVVGQAVEAMGSIERSSQEINAIIDLIEGIAFQTNLLALNAGIEAARAGSAGRGFAVVANEVRALAQRSSEAAAGIKKLIKTSSEQVGDGVDRVSQTGALLDRIASEVKAAHGMLEEITRAAQEQAASLEQVNVAVREMDTMTQQNAAMVEQSTAAAQALAGEAARLDDLVGSFRTRSDETVQPFRPLRAA